MHMVVSPPVQSANQASDPFHLNVKVTDQCRGIPVADMIHLIMAHHYK